MQVTPPKTLNLTLKKRWFDMIEARIKPEEYREIKDYWVERLMYNASGYNPCGIGTKTSSVFNYAKGFTGSRAKAIEHMLEKGFKFKSFPDVSANNGYAKDCPNVKWEHKGIRIGEGKPEWGAETGVQYFILEIGNIINQ